MEAFAGITIMVGQFPLGSDVETAARTLGDTIRERRRGLRP